MGASVRLSIHVNVSYCRGQFDMNKWNAKDEQGQQRKVAEMAQNPKEEANKLTTDKSIDADSKKMMQTSTGSGVGVISSLMHLKWHLCIFLWSPVIACTNTHPLRTNVPTWTVQAHSSWQWHTVFSYHRALFKWAPQENNKVAVPGPQTHFHSCHVWCEGSISFVCLLPVCLLFAQACRTSPGRVHTSRTYSFAVLWRWHTTHHKRIIAIEWFYI